MPFVGRTDDAGLARILLAADRVDPKSCLTQGRDGRVNDGPHCVEGIYTIGQSIFDSNQWLESERYAGLAVNASQHYQRTYWCATTARFVASWAQEIAHKCSATGVLDWG